MRRSIGFFSGLFLVGLVNAGLGMFVPASLSAQTILHSDDFASSGGSAYRNTARDATGTIYALSIRQIDTGDRDLILHSSTDGGASWDLDPFILNDATSGQTPPEPTNLSAMAIDDQGTLHITWGRYYYPSFYQQFYRQYDPGTGFASPIVDVSAITSAAPTSRTAAMDVAVDEGGSVWLVAHGPSSWVERLLQSSLPYASDLTFQDLGNVSPTASAQNTRVAVDLEGRIHCSFYRNIGQGNYEHRIWDPAAAAWSPTTVIGNTTGTNDYYGALAADALGNVHALLVVDAANTTEWEFWYRRWDIGVGWSDPITLFTATTPQYSGIANYRIFALACDEDSGTAYVAYRDLSDGASLDLVQKAIGDPDFTFVEELQPPSPGLHEYYVPTIRGNLFPEFDRTATDDLLITFHNRPLPDPPFSFVAQTVDVGGTGGGPEFLRGDADGNGSFTGLVDGLFVLNYQFVSGSPAPPCLSAADADDNGSFTGLVDGLFILNYQFVSGSPPPPPPGIDECGVDPTADGLGCESAPLCP